jgi:hypothetical protein
MGEPRTLTLETTMSLTDDLSDGFFQKVVTMCNNLGCDPQNMLKVWFSESIGIYADAKTPLAPTESIR